MARGLRWSALILAAILAGGCSGDESAPGPTPAPTTATASMTSTPSATPTPKPTWPLTGLPAPATPTQPALTVKVDNTAAARPQVGLSAADLVVEELVEGGLTRLAAVYHSQLPPAVTPVRSVRTSDVGIVLPAGGAVAASGGAGRVLRALRSAGVDVLTEGTAGFSRVGGRRAPYNVTVDPARVVSALSAEHRPAAAYLPWGPAPSGRPVTGMDVVFSRAHTTSWRPSGQGWQREPELAATGDEFRPANVLVLAVPIRDAGYRDPAGNPVPETVFEGSGSAWLLVDGGLVPGTWSKSDPAAPLRLADPNGRPMHVPPGRTWVELMPDTGEVRPR